jgi:tetratricopeptide (TPR) repeat protein
VEYWRTKYHELTPAADPRAAKAHTIFQRLVQVAGKRPGVVPQLVITTSDPWDIVLPIALPDGGIILSKGVLALCYQEPTWGDDRLAFVLAHELAHQLHDDFWHMRFFQALDTAKPRGSLPPQESPTMLAEVRRTASDTEAVFARELRADERGIMYAAMAGFNPHAIVTERYGVNFFATWVQALDPRRLAVVSLDLLRPTPQERAAALTAHLRRVAETTVVFQAGLWFYYAGDYSRAIQAFAHFRPVFPSREVVHNLATSHHQLALQAAQVGPPPQLLLPFHLSLAIDPLSRASQISLEEPKRGSAAASQTPAGRFRQHLDEAIALYREALAYDAAYIPAALNLGGALMLRGMQTGTSGLNADVSEAQTLLLRMLERAPDTPDTPAILNSLGVALFYAGHVDQATAHLTRARTLAPTYAAPVFNLGYIARAERRDAEAQRYWSDYAQLHPAAAPLAQHQFPEDVMELTIGRLDTQTPAHWGAPATRVFRVGDERFVAATYPRGVTTLSQDGEIVMLLVQDSYPGTSRQGIAIGSDAREVLARYGAPTRRIDMTQGHNWAYDPQRIAFQLRAGKVVSWLVF